MKARVTCLLLVLAGASTAAAQQSGSITGRVFAGVDSAITALVSIDNGISMSRQVQRDGFSSSTWPQASTRSLRSASGTHLPERRCGFVGVGKLP